MLPNEIINAKLIENGWKISSFQVFSKFMNRENNYSENPYDIDQLFRMFSELMNEKLLYPEREIDDRISGLLMYPTYVSGDQTEIKKQILDLIKQQKEMAYRRGYSHGFEAGLLNDEASVKKYDYRNKINDWRRDYEIKKGAPATSFENVNVIA